MTEQTQTITCPSCGGQSHPEAGSSHMSCTYCGTNITIPASMRVKAEPPPRIELQEPKPRQMEFDSSEVLRKAEPIARRVFNLYAMWTWVRWLLPTCLIIFVVFFVLCTLLGALPFVFRLFR